MTELYTILVLLLIRRYMIDQSKWDEDSEFSNNLKELPEEIIPVLKRVSELAYTGLFGKEGQSQFSSSNVGKDFEHLGLLSTSKEMYLTRGAQTSYSFLHLSVQEFLAAWHVSCNTSLTVEAISALLTTEPCPSPPFMYFLAGLIGTGKFPEIKNKKVGFYLQCFYEAQNPTDNEFLASSCPTKDVILFHKPLDMYLFGYALVHVPLQWYFLVSVAPLDELVSSIADHAPLGAQILRHIENAALLNLSVLHCLSMIYHCMLPNYLLFSLPAK